MAEASIRGRFLWEGLVAADPAAAASFYGQVVGWTAAAWEADPSHTLLHAGSGAVADVAALSEAMRAQGTRPRWLSYIGSEDVDATVERAVGLGARVVSPPSDLKQVGRVAVLADPHGATFGVYTPTRPGAPKGAPGIGEPAWHELMCPDPAAALRFYGQLFGWEQLQRLDMGPIGFYYIFGAGGVQLGGMFKPSQPLTGPQAAWVLYVSVPDADAAAAMAAKLGGKLCNGPMDVPGGGRIAQLQAPDGVLFAVHSMAAPQAARPASTSRPPAARKKRPAAATRPTATPPPAEPAKPAAKPRPAARAKVAASAKSAAATRPSAAAKPAARKPSAPAGSAPRRSGAKSKARARPKRPAPAEAARKVAQPAARQVKLDPRRREKARRKAEKAQRKLEKKLEKQRKKDKKKEKKKKKDRKARRKK